MILHQSLLFIAFTLGDTDFNTYIESAMYNKNITIKNQRRRERRSVGFTRTPFSITWILKYLINQLKA